MIDRQYGFIILECDDCENNFKSNKGDEFDKVWSEAKDDGWQARKVGNDWAHFCGAPCQPEDD